MSVNSDLSLASSMVKVVGTLVDLAEEQQEKANKSHALVETSAPKLAEAADRLGGTIKAVPEQVRSAVKESMKGAARDAADLLSEKFTIANQHADQAAARFKKAGEECSAVTNSLRKGALLSVSVICVSACLITVIAVYAAIRLLVPSNAEINARRDLVLKLDGEIIERQVAVQRLSEKAGRLNKTISELRLKGGSVKPVNCTVDGRSHLCIQTINSLSGATELTVVNEVTD